jgi:hypothetical protein
MTTISPREATPSIDTKKLRAYAFEQVAVAQRVLTQTTTPYGFYAAMGDLLHSQRRLLASLPGNETAVKQLDALMDTLSAANEARRDTRW